MQPKRNHQNFASRSVHGSIAHELGHRIVSGAFEAGHVFPNEDTLSLEFGVSRTALREALKILSAKGLIEVRPKTGTRVRPAQEWNFLDRDVLGWWFGAAAPERRVRALLEVRQIIEPAAAALVAARAPAAARRRITAAYQELERAWQEPEISTEPDVRFHQEILNETGNVFLRAFGLLIDTALQASIRLSGSQPGARERALPRHRAVAEGIAARDPQAARTAMEALLEGALGNIDRAVRSGRGRGR
jgi:DNA-binding FadR family transcriptional regulator